MGSHVWRIIVLISILFAKTLQHGTIQKPTTVNGCYHGDEGTFFWTVSGDNLYLNISSEMNEEEWVGIAFSDDTFMGNDDVVAVYKNQYTQSFIAASLIDPYRYNSTVVQETESIIDKSITYADGHVEANLTKSVELSFPFEKLHQTSIYLFFGKGRIRLASEENSDTKPLHRHYVNPTISRDPVPLYKKTHACISTQTNKLIKLHGILMVLVWLNLAPLAVYIARYAKYYFKRQTIWFTIHKYSGILSGVLVIAAVIVAYISLKQLELGKHQILGISVLLVLIVHVFLAIFRPPHQARYRRLWEIVHKATAGLLFVGSITNIVNGLFMLKAHDICYWAISGQITIYCLLFIVMENPQQISRLLSRVCICLRLSPQVYYSLNSQLKDDNSDSSDCEDITMVTMNLDNAGAGRSAFVRFGLWTTVLVNLAVSVTVISALANI